MGMGSQGSFVSKSPIWDATNVLVLDCKNIRYYVILEMFNRESGFKCLKNHIRPRMFLSGIEAFGNDIRGLGNRPF